MAILYVLVAVFVCAYWLPVLSRRTDRFTRMPWRDQPWLVDALVPKAVTQNEKDNDAEDWTEVQPSQDEEHSSR